MYAVKPKPYPNWSRATQVDMIQRLEGWNAARKTKDRHGRVRARAIGHRDFFNPQRDAAIPPRIPPAVSEATPIVP